MKGYVTRLCDIDSIGIPDEMLEVHIDKERIEKQIAALSLRYANEISSIICARGDIVRCKADEASYPDKRTIILFTGASLPAAEEAQTSPSAKSSAKALRPSLPERAWS